MTNDKSILIKNIYYMLCYVFPILKQNNYNKIASEKFEKTQDLFAAILSKGIAQQLKRGLYYEYITQYETLSVLRGKLNVSQTLHNKMQKRQKLYCEFDELSENNLYNQILKTTIYFIIKDKNLSNKYRTALNKLLIFFNDITLLEPSKIKWQQLHYQHNNKNYEMLLNICYFVLHGMLQTTEKGKYHIINFSEEHMAKLYEKFILEYYRYHHSYLSKIKPAQIKWNLTMQNDKSMTCFLPIMQTDVMLCLHDKTVIIDAKYYSHILQKHYDKYKLHSTNLYQIFAYVKNQDKNNTGNVSGILLYAKTEEDITPNFTFHIGGNQIEIKTLDLNTDFKIIAKQLDNIVTSYFKK
ncbi:5-methylcytosine-specific restriction endonuclease system specificity protein McrC [Clostridium sp. MD294]|uniref:5-methylcytosine-specific restriction endonuclease system specificity protein McrC n=1 Tax=Clostridium sp. MD294 TaxID=97138 RepID=UPI0005544019|nr:5-methylcytosine-specific restriction endonuclease system specificity protein McrC [Clostridium sp. MD294]NDO46953.1 5-methylcytosine-specific restriction endonuclease system specificity protein McrC [Clostridium sp. MD294]